MKQRIFNILYRKTHIVLISKLLATMIFAAFKSYYLIESFFIKRDKNSLKLKKEIVIDAEKKVSIIREKPKMETAIINEPIDRNVELSIIVPAYNVEEYIGECLNSILSQKTKYNCEVIIVNDGSTDDTKEIIKNFKDRRIKYYEQENQGLSAARNTGLNNAKGKNVLFVDSDDVICDGAIDKMLDAIIENKADIVVGSHYMFTNNNKSKHTHTHTQ